MYKVLVEVQGTASFTLVFVFRAEGRDEARRMAMRCFEASYGDNGHIVQCYDLPASPEPPVLRSN